MIAKCPRALMFLSLLSLAPAAPPQGDNGSQEEAALREQVRKLEEKLETARSNGIRSIRVNGVELTPQHIRREAIFLVGAKMVEAKLADFFVDEWMETQIKEGRDPKDFEISEEVIMKSLEDQVAEFRAKYPDVAFWEAVRAMTGFSKEGYMQFWRQSELFKRVFFPGPATNWPSITREAIMASAAGTGGKEFWENIEKNSIDPQTHEPKELPAFWLQLCQTWVQKQLKKWSDIRYPSDGLPADIVLSVNGRTWKTDEAFEFVRPALFLMDIERAMAELVIREALKQDLVKHDAYLNDEEFRKTFDDYRQEYDNTPFTTEVIATAFKGYPSLEAYRQRWRLIKSFENMIAKDINDDTLRAHGEKYQRFFGEGQTSVDVIQFLAKDVKTGAWEPNGFERAKERAEKGFRAIADGASFDKLREEVGEFYVTDEAKGRLGSKALNQLRQALHETEFTDLLMGYSAGAYLFYEAEPGTITSPLRGPDGYYIARVNARSPAHGAATVDNPRTRELIKQDYVTQRFMSWANEVLAKAVIE